MRRVKRIILLVLLLCIRMQVLQAQEVVAHLSVDTNKILIGKPVKIILHLTQPNNISINWPLFSDSVGQLEILQAFPVDTLNIEDDHILLRSQTITVTSFDSGVFRIPEIVFNYKLPGEDKLQTASTDPFFIEAFTVPVDTTSEIRDIRPVQDAPFDPMLLVWIIVIYHAVLLLLGLIVWYLRKKAKGTAAIVTGTVPVIPAHVTAMEALAALESEQIWQKGHYKTYHTLLTDIIRQYLDNRWKVGAAELTTDEILSNSFTLTLKEENRMDLERILRLADLVKFAKLTPVPGENENAMKWAVKFVEDTTPSEIVKTEMKLES